ncbi:MAG: phage protein GemA/Gp16 family protein [Eubacterium sp.]
MLKPHQTQRIYAMGARLGLLESGNKNDLLHELVYGITEKSSIRELSEQEYKEVVKELAERLKLQNLEIPPCHPYKAQRYEDSGRGKMSDGQKRKVWRLMYQLEELDEKPSSAKLGDRLCGIIKKELHIDSIPKQPFIWLTYQQGVTLIEIIKKYVANAQRRKDGVGRT